MKHFLLITLPVVAVVLTLLWYKRRNELDSDFSPTYPEDPKPQFPEATLTRENYTYLSYAEMRSRLKALAQEYPDIMHLTNSKEKYGIAHEVECSDG